MIRLIIISILSICPRPGYLDFRLDNRYWNGMVIEMTRDLVYMDNQTLLFGLKKADNFPLWWLRPLDLQLLCLLGDVQPVDRVIRLAHGEFVQREPEASGAPV